jgi:hypothetical protein
VKLNKDRRNAVKIMLEKSYGVDFIELDLDPKTAGFVLDAISKARFYREPYLPGGERAFVEQRKPEIRFETLTENGSYVFECEADFEAWKEQRETDKQKEAS